MTRSRYPTLQVPVSVPADVRTFLEGVKERLEITTGDRGDPRDRLLTVRDIEAAGMASVRVVNRFATLTGGVSNEGVEGLIAQAAGAGAGTFEGVSVPTIDQLEAGVLGAPHDFIIYNNALARLQRLNFEVLRSLLLTESSDAEVDGYWQFLNEDIALELRAEAPRLRFTEMIGLGETEAVDANVWDLLVDSQTLSVNLIGDDETTSVQLLEMGRDGLDPTYFALLNNTVLRLQPGTEALPGLTFEDPTTGLFEAAANSVSVATEAVERLRVDATGLTVTGTAAITAATGHLDVTPSVAADFALLKVRDAASVEIWQLTSEVDGDLDFARQSGTGLLRVNGVSVIDAALFTTGTLDDARLSGNVVLLDAVQTLTNKTIDTADNDITVDQADVTGLIDALALKLDIASYTPADVLTKLLTVDGAGSLLDADLLDGLDSTDFAPLAHTHVVTDITGITTDRLLGRASALTGVMEEITLGTGLSFTGTTLNATGGGGGVTDGDMGDVVVSGGGTVWTVDAGAISYAKMQNATTARLLGRASALAGVIEEITLGSNLSFTGTTLNAVPGGATTNIQFNDGGVLSGNANFTWAKTTRVLALGDGAVSSGVTIRPITRTVASGVGADLTIIAGSPLSNATGGTLFLKGAQGQGASQPGGSVIIDGGQSGTTGSGGVVTITGGVGTATAGSVTIAGAAKASGSGGTAMVIGGQGTGGGAVSLTGGTGTGSSGGAVSIAGGLATAATGSPGGVVTITGGNARGNSMTGGHITVTAGACTTASTADGGNLVLTAGAGASVGGTGGESRLIAGAAFGVAVGGAALLRGGAAVTGTAGGASVEGGVASAGTHGAVRLVTANTDRLKITGTGGFELNTTDSTTVGAAGAAAALPAAPLGYWLTSINGTACKIPYFSV